MMEVRQMEFNYLHFFILSCIFFGVGLFLLNLLREDRQPHDETVADGTITYVTETDGGNLRVHVELTYDGELYPDLVILCKQHPDYPALEGRQVRVACYRNKEGNLEGRILDEDFEKLSVSYTFPVILLILGALSAIAALYFFIKLS